MKKRALQLSILAALAGGAVRAAEAEAVQIVLGVGEIRRVDVDARIERVSLANPGIVAATLVTPTQVELRGLTVGRTLMMLWQIQGRRLVVIRVEASARPGTPSEPEQLSASTPLWKPGQTLHMYRGRVYGDTQPGVGVRFGGQGHTISSTVPTGPGTTTAIAGVSVPLRESAELDVVEVRYRDAHFDLQGGDLSLGTYSQIAPVRALRGGAAGYFDDKYRVLVYGGVRRGLGEDFFGGSDDPQLGAQAQVAVADNLALSLDGGYERRPVGAGADESNAWIAPGAHWLPIEPLTFDAQGAWGLHGAAARTYVVFDAPLLSVHALYQSLGGDYLAARTPRTDFAQVMAIGRPSTYYSLVAIAGRATSNGDLFATTPGADTSFVSAGFNIVPAPSFDLGFRYHHARDTWRDALARETWNRSHTLELSAQGDVQLFGARHQYRVAPYVEWLRTQALGAARAGEGVEIGLSALWIAPLVDDALGLQTYATAAQTRAPSPVGGAFPVAYDVSVSEGLVARAGPMLGYAQLGAGWAFETAGTRRSTISGLLAGEWRPSRAHEVRLDLQVAYAVVAAPVPGPGSWAGQGLLSYAYYFGTAVDAAPFFGLFDTGEITIVLFRDRNENGSREAEEGGVTGVSVVVDGGESRATNSEGVVEFGSLSPGAHRVEIDAASLPGIKLMGASSYSVEVLRGGDHAITLGVSDRARIVGQVFIDGDEDGQRDVDEPGLDEVDIVLLSGGDVAARLTSTGSGGFSFAHLDPGAYEVKVVARSLPPDFSANGYAFTARAEPPAGSASPGRIDGGTVRPAAPTTLGPGQVTLMSIPIRAIRMLQGRVFIDRDGDHRFHEGVDTPAAAVAVRCNDAVSQTDAAGAFLGRGLHAGALEIQVDPTTVLEGLVAPAPRSLELPYTPSHLTVDLEIGTSEGQR